MLIDGMKGADAQIAQLAALMYKKLFLDDAAIADKISVDDLESMKQSVMSTIDFSSQTIQLLKRKGEIISKIYSKQQRSEELLNLLVQWASSEFAKGRQFAMYLFEVLADCHLSAEQIKKYKDSFMQVFSASLKDKEVAVRVAALKATISFLTSIDDSDVVLQYAGIVPAILNTVVEALQENEDQGRSALESMVELTNACPELWKANTPLLVNIISQVLTQKSFEDGTRSVATEVILALSSQMPAALRKAEETRILLIPAVVQMLTEVEEDLDVWASTVEEKEGAVGHTDPHHVAINAINCLSNDLGEKSVFGVFSGLIQQCIKS